MTAINSNRAIRGPVTAVPVVAGKGVRLVADIENNRWVVEADETVLFESNNVSGTVLSANQYITLSESLKNFDRVRIYYVMQDSWGASLTHEVCNITGDRRIVMEQLWYRDAAGFNNYWQSMVFSKYTDADLRITLIDSVQRPLLQGSWAASGLSLTIYKVVGINRIASN